LSLALALSPRGTRWTLGLVGVLGTVLFLTVGCEASGESGPSTTDQAKENEACPESQRPIAAQKSKTGQDPSGSCVAQNHLQTSDSETTVRSTLDSKLQGSGPQNIAGMNAEAALTTLQKPGLECWQPVDRDVLYACSGDENPDLLYEARITGSDTDEVSSVEARVFWQGKGDFELASQPFFGLLSAQLKYRGSDSNEAFEFVNRNLSSTKAVTTIGSATWTITTSDDSKELTLTPA
jgi:hypothetical protein